MTWKSKILIGIAVVLAALIALYFYGRSLGGFSSEKKTTAEQKPTDPPPCVRSKQAQNTQNIHYCPNPKDLYRTKISNRWTAPGGWRSNDTSLSTEIKQFTRAEWSGTADRGKVTCVYVADGLFPVSVYQKDLTLRPSQNRWGNAKLNKNRKIGCIAMNYDTCECGFSFAPDPSKQKALSQSSFKWIPARSPDDLMSPFTCIHSFGSENCF